MKEMRMKTYKRLVASILIGSGIVVQLVAVSLICESNILAQWTITDYDCLTHGRKHPDRLNQCVALPYSTCQGSGTCDCGYSYGSRKDRVEWVYTTCIYVPPESCDWDSQGFPPQAICKICLEYTTWTNTVCNQGPHDCVEEVPLCKP